MGFAGGLSPIEVIEKWVGFDTVTYHSNLPLIAWTKDYLARLGVTAKLIPSPDGTKASLFATIGPDVPGGVVLSGHTDVVPVAGQDWTSDPFTLTRRGDHLVGRGTVDMKSFGAIALAMVPVFLERGLRRPIHLAFSYDEEQGCTGVRPMIDDMVASGLAPQAVIVGEPTGMEIVNGHKGGLLCWTTVRGKAYHSSQPANGANAIRGASRLVGHLFQEADRFASGPQDEAFDPSHSTLSVNLIDGGIAANTVPDRCRFFFEMRVLPGVSDLEVFERYEAIAAEVDADLEAQAPEAGVDVELQARVPALAPEDDGAAEALVKALAGTNSDRVVSYGTEAGLFQNAGYSTVICGPGDGTEAHLPDEKIAVEQVEACAAFLGRLADRLAG